MVILNAMRSYFKSFLIITFLAISITEQKVLFIHYLQTAPSKTTTLKHKDKREWGKKKDPRIDEGSYFISQPVNDLRA